MDDATLLYNAAQGVHGPSQEWLEFNRTHAFEIEGGLSSVAPFPPPTLMQNTTGLKDNRDFAEHGVSIFNALEIASPQPLNTYRHILDFGVGVGRLARLFHGFKGAYTGVDVDERHIEWVSKAFPHVKAVLSRPKAPLSLPDGAFDMVVSISVFTHMNHQDTAFYLNELLRVTAPGGYLFLTVHGARAFERAQQEESIFQMLAIPRRSLIQAGAALKKDGYAFVRQDGHLTSKDYDYGITFINETFVQEKWAPKFASATVNSGAIHDFQDIVVLKKQARV